MTQSLTSDESAAELLRAALQQRRSGVLDVRGRQTSGSIHVQDGHIVWAHVSSMPVSLSELLRAAGIDVAPSTAAELVAEASETQSHIGDVLVRRRIVEPGELRELLRRHLDQRVAAALRIPSATALFRERKLREVRDMRFRRSEFPGLRESQPLPASDSPPPAASSDSQSQLVDIRSALMLSLLTLPGAMGAAVIDRDSGSIIAFEGASTEQNSVRAAHRLFEALGAEGEDVIGVAGDQCVLLRAIRCAPTTLGYVVVSLKQVTVGLARCYLTNLCEQSTLLEAAQRR